MVDVGSIFLSILIGTFSLVTENDGGLSLVVWLILLEVSFVLANVPVLGLVVVKRIQAN